jgi:hypothetical protein
VIAAVTDPALTAVLLLALFRKSYTETVAFFTNERYLFA